MKNLKKKGYSIQANWQDLNEKSIFFLGTNNSKNFHIFIKKALKKGCKYILCDKKFKKEYEYEKLNFFYFESNIDLIKIIKTFFSKPKSKIIFVTGTNGKTSVAYGSHKLLNLNGINSAYIGTLGFYINSKRIKNLRNTTPNLVEIYSLINFAEKFNCKYIFLETSSIGYKQGRLGSLKYDICFLTNLKSDHLDYHKSLKNYHLSKIEMIKEHAKNNSKIFIQDYKILDKYFKTSKNAISQKDFIENKGLNFIKDKETKFSININNNKYKIYAHNKFVLDNTISVICLYYILFKNFPIFLNSTIHPKGRSEIVYNNNDRRILIDYAHSADAFKNLLTSFTNKLEKIIVLYGCGGDRDTTKRPIIAKIVSNFSDIQIITDDNPRKENPKKIRDLLVKNSKNPISIPNREKAIKYGIKVLSKNKGILIIAGKGHENKQIYKDRTVRFSDHLMVKKYAKNI